MPYLLATPQRRLTTPQSAPVAGGAAPAKRGGRRRLPSRQRPIARFMPRLDAVQARENGVTSGTRTHDIQSHNLTLYQLNYSHHMARLEGLEPPTHGLEGRCSIQLSYRRRP